MLNQNPIIKNTISKTIALCCLVFMASTVQAKVELTLDRNNIRENETFQLTVHVDEAATLSSAKSIDFIPAEFQILKNERFQKSTVINGKFANRMGWALQLVSSSSGTFSIPPFTIGNESSVGLNIRVLPALDELDDINPNSKIKLSASISSTEVYVQQQIIYTVRIYSSAPTRRRSISALQVENAVIEKLGDPAEFQMINKGIKYNVLEEKYVIFPQKSGELTIDPIQFRTNIVDTEASFGSLSRYRPIELNSQKFKINVKPKSEMAETPWIPAKLIEITTNWQPENQDFEVGSPASIDFIIKGVGLLPEQLPQIEFPDIEGLKIYRDKPIVQTRINSHGVTSYHLEKLAIIPNAAGQAVIPEIKIPYWNTSEDKQDYAVSKAISIDIKERSNSVALPSFGQTAPTTTTSDDNNSGINSSDSFIWKLAASIFATLWLLTLSFTFFIKRSKKLAPKQDANVDNSHSSSSSKPQVSLKQACQSKDPSLVSQSIIDWLNHERNLKVSNLEQVINKCAQADQPELKEQLESLQKSLYAAESSADKLWDGDTISHLLKQSSFNQGKKKSHDKLPPLYPE